MGIYQSEETLKKSLDSLLVQTFQDFDIILCDDGSSDNTYTIAKEYTKRFPEKIFLIRNEINHGLAYSLNYCLKYARGEYIARMDADDISVYTRFEKQIDYLEKHPEFSLVGSSVQLFNNKGVFGIRVSKEYPQKTDFLFSSQFIHPTILIKRSVLQEIGGYSVEKITRRTEDYELFMRLYSMGYIGYNFQIPLLYYREDRNTLKRRSYKYRLDEAKIRYRGFKQLDLLPLGFPYVVKPLIVGLIPQKFLMRLRFEKAVK